MFLENNPNCVAKEVYANYLSVLFLFFSERVSSQSQRRFLTEMGMPTTGQLEEKIGCALFYKSLSLTDTF